MRKIWDESAPVLAIDHPFTEQEMGQFMTTWGREVVSQVSQVCKTSGETGRVPCDPSLSKKSLH